MKRDQDIGRKAMLRDVKTAFMFTLAVNRLLVVNSAVNNFMLKDIKNSTSSTRLPNLETKNVNLQQQRTEQTWHQNEAKPRESRRNAPTREKMRLFASNIKKLQ